MLLLYVHISSMQCRREGRGGCGGGCSVCKDVLLIDNLVIRIFESWFCCSLLNPTKPPFCVVIILVLEILIFSKEYAFNKQSGRSITRPESVIIHIRMELFNLQKTILSVT